MASTDPWANVGPRQNEQHLDSLAARISPCWL
jgi:hypothetical protein